MRRLTVADQRSSAACSLPSADRTGPLTRCGLASKSCSRGWTAPTLHPIGRPDLGHLDLGLHLELGPSAAPTFASAALTATSSSSARSSPARPLPPRPRGSPRSTDPPDSSSAESEMSSASPTRHYGAMAASELLAQLLERSAPKSCCTFSCRRLLLERVAPLLRARRSGSTSVGRCSGSDRSSAHPSTSRAMRSRVGDEVGGLRVEISRRLDKCGLLERDLIVLTRAPTETTRHRGREELATRTSGNLELRAVSSDCRFDNVDGRREVGHPAAGFNLGLGGLAARGLSSSCPIPRRAICRGGSRARRRTSGRDR